MFKKDESGKNRDWQTMDEREIRALWSHCKRQMDEVVHDFKYIKIPKAALTEARRKYRF